MLFHSTVSTGQIALPSAPAAVPPPAIPPERDPVLLRRQEHKKAQEQTRKELEAAPEKKADQVREAIAREEAATPRPLYGFLELNMLYPIAATSGGRSKYHPDISTHFSGWMRLSPDKPAESVQIWAGIRLAPFSGYGTQKQYTGRFALTYFGPGIAVGHIKAPAIDAPAGQVASRHGWLLSTGVAAVSRMTANGEHPSQDQSDFTSSSWAFDEPGLWAELRSIHIFHGVLSANLLAGTQLGKGKNFAYFGVGIAGWL